MTEPDAGVGPSEPERSVWEPAEDDEALAAERTELAWGRSALALIVCGLAVARGFPKVTGADAHPLAGAFVLVAGSLAWLAGVPYARARARAGHDGVRHVASAGELAPLALGTVLVGVAALLVDVVLPR